MTAPEVVPNPEPHPDPRASVPGKTQRAPGRATPQVKPAQRGTSAPPPPPAQS